LELTEKGVESAVDDLVGQMRERDHRDRTREDSPLKQADDAIAVDTDGLTIDQVVDTILALCRKRMQA
jgi:cytidylate kinase